MSVRFLAYRSWIPNEDFRSAISVCCWFDIQTLKETSVLCRFIFRHLKKYHGAFFGNFVTHSMTKFAVFAISVPTAAKTLYHLTKQTPRFHRARIKQLDVKEKRWAVEMRAWSPKSTAFLVLRNTHSSFLYSVKTSKAIQAIRSFLRTRPLNRTPEFSNSC